MLQIKIPAGEFYDDKTNTFITTKEQVLTLEHSLVSLSKWESKWCKAFLGNSERTTEETIDYIKCMTITPNVDDEVYLHLTPEIFKEVSDYIQNPHTATWFSDENVEGKSKKTRSSETVTSELIYYWMIALQIPFECQKWHLNRLLTLIKVCNLKNQPAKKMKRSEILSRNHALNEARKKQLHTNG